MATLAAAEARATKQLEDTELLWKSWDKLQQDIARGVAGPPQDLSTINLEEQLLVDSFWSAGKTCKRGVEGSGHQQLPSQPCK